MEHQCIYSETVREPQLVITTPDPCGRYEATVTPMCGTQTTQINLGGEFTVYDYAYSILLQSDTTHYATGSSNFTSDLCQ